MALHVARKPKQTLDLPMDNQGKRFMLCRGCAEQMQRVDRLLSVVNSTNPYPIIGNIEFDDLLHFTIQSMWHMKDWILNDPSLSPEIKKTITIDIHSRRCLLICADLANGTKHMSLRTSKTGFTFTGQTGMHLDGKHNICMRYYEIQSSDPSDSYHLMEIRDLLAECRKAWEEIAERVEKSLFEEIWSELIRDESLKSKTDD